MYVTYRCEYLAVMITSERAQLALDTILQKPVKGVPSWLIHPMDIEHIERLAGAAPGDYRRHPDQVYIAFQRAVGTCLLDQYLATNPLSMGPRGYENPDHGATTGAAEIVVDDIVIDSPEAVVQHLASVVFPRLRAAADGYDEDARVKQIIDAEAAAQRLLGPDILKGPYGCIAFPCFAYTTYGYAHYFSAYALYPEVIERHLSLQADAALLNNRAAARAFVEGGLPPICRLDHDMADSRGTLVRVETLDRLWFPHFARCLAPLLETDVRLLWHCDGNLMEMVPRLLEVGLRGFQGFQYEDGMDYERICRMKTRDGDDLVIIAGVSVTRTLPMGTPADVKREIDWLVAHGPKTGLFLGGSSTICPGTPWDNLVTLVEGMDYYRTHGRA